MYHINSNSKKAKNGYDLNSNVKEILSNKLLNKEIKKYTYEPKYKFPGYDNFQFRPDGEIVLNNDEIIIIDNTTSARHDRFKQKQWDAYGTKKYFNEFFPNAIVRYYIILPDIENLGSIETRDKEYKNYIREKDKFNSKNYYSEIDDILQVSDLVKLIEEKCA